MTLASVIGAGMIPFGKHEDQNLVDMAAEACRLALKDSGVSPERVDAAFFSCGIASRLFGDFTIGQNVFWEVGINRIPVVNVENACTSGSTAFYLACNMVAAGQAEVALVCGAEKMCIPGFGLISSGDSQLDTQLGMVAPAGFALRAVRHMAEYGTTKEQLARVSVKNRAHGAKNPMAQFRDLITVEDVLGAPMIVDPLTRLSCCPIADGAAAVLIASPEAAKHFSRRVQVKSAVLVTGSYENPQDLARWETDRRGADLAYEKAGMGPEDIHLVECHDAFTISEILHYEALGLCGPGEGGRLIDEGVVSLGGKVPVNPSGGLLSRGHPVGATGVAQIVEVVTQLRHEAGPRQVEGAQTGLAHCMGGDKDGDSKSCTVSIFSV